MNKIFNYISGMVMVFLLLLLTAGLPLTIQTIKVAKDKMTQNQSSDKNPYSNSTEEKTPINNISFSEEYVHENQHDFSLIPQQVSVAYIHAHEALYVAYHGELHYPPPNFFA